MELAKEIEELFYEWRYIPYKDASTPVIKQFSEWLAEKLRSRLASRVEELDAEIARLGADHNLEYCDCEFCELRAFRFKQRLADRGLAGAHAEEKSK